ncbi:MAG: hypothetical protein H6698_06095 [Myxococcales bacterium]|nr:hypothetical protein [Myxococcales bacterium]MCB9521693.1 hypothetical protein [Myxococcales bacterium]MCB9531909.1 hypothetical protein [Myxococcales bacterium]MCB9533877.1 hypothetical protein [Myxococcales bacterium]
MNAFRVLSIGNIPVFVTPFFLLVLLLSGMGLGSIGERLVWAAVLTVSVLIHELGHATVANALGLRPHIFLHGFGGFCAHARAQTDRHEALVVAAGPAAGLLLAAVVWGGTTALSHTGSGLLDQPLVALGLGYALQVNIFWSILNLAPLWPLDGGHLFRLGMLRVAKPGRAERVTASVGVLVALAALGWGLSAGLTFVALFGGLFGWQNIEVLRGMRSMGPVRPSGDAAARALVEARAAFGRSDWDEAARQCHVLRSEPNVSDSVLEESWAILGVADLNRGRPREASAALRRTTFDAAVGERLLAALVEAREDDEAVVLLESDSWRRLGPAGDDVRERVLRAAGFGADD